MGDSYLHIAQKYRGYLISWVNKSIKNESWVRHEHLHIDEIGPEFSDSGIWIKSSLSLYEVILDLLKTDTYCCLLVIPLCYSEGLTDFGITTWSEVEALLDMTPPSYYLYPRGEMNYEATLAGLQFSEALSDECGYKVYFKSEGDIDGNSGKTLYVNGR